MSFKKFDGSTWSPITPKQLKGIPYTGTLPATLTGTKAGYLHRYKIYGNTEQTGIPTPENPIVPSECGEKTENLFDYTTIVPGYTYNSNGQMVLNPDELNRWLYAAVPFIEVVPGATYLRTYNLEPAGNTINFYDNNKNFLEQATPGTGRPVAIPSNCKFVSYVVNIGANDRTKYMFTKGSSAPSAYIPYGYKLPLTSGSTPVDIYIGDDTLSTEEYVDSGTGKVYRMVGGVLTPVDPPMPFPQIPTSAGSTVISWAGEGLAPSELESVQEWVDIPTYTRVNGVWVADN